MRKIMVSAQMEKTIKDLDNKRMKKELSTILYSVSLLEQVDEYFKLKSVKKIQDENMYIFKINKDLRMVFTETTLENGEKGIILLDLFKHEDYLKFIKERISIDDFID